MNSVSQAPAVITDAELTLTDAEVKAIVNPIFARMERRWADVKSVPELAKFANQARTEEVTQEEAEAISAEFRRIQFTAIIEAFIAGFKSGKHSQNG